MFTKRRYNKCVFHEQHWKVVWFSRTLVETLKLKEMYNQFHCYYRDPIFLGVVKNTVFGDEIKVALFCKKISVRPEKPDQ